MKKEKSQQDLNLQIVNKFAPKMCSPGPDSMYTPSPCKGLKAPILLD